MKYMVAQESKDRDLRKVVDLFDSLVEWKKIRSNHWIAQEFGSGAVNQAETWLRQFRWTDNPNTEEKVWVKGKYRVNLIVLGDQAHAYVGM